MEHFGVKLRERKKGFNINRNTFAMINTKPSLPFFDSLVKINAYVDEVGSAYKKEWCEEYRKICLKNYYLNMKYFSMLDEKEFNDSLNKFLKQYKGFKNVENLNKYKFVEGYYILVLDEYKQIYIGKSSDIRKRIVQHWTKIKSFDRTLLPMYAYEKSTFSIDFFGALDTTRIFVWKTKMEEGIERELIQNFPKKFCTNRIGGDVTIGIEALATMNVRDLK